METGLEIFSNTNFWGLDLSGSEVEPEIEPEPAPAPAPVGVTTPEASVASLVEELQTQGSSSGLPLKLWCAIVESLEAKGVFTRDELISMLRRLSSAN